MQQVERKNRKTLKHGRAVWLLLAFILLAGSVTAAVLLTRQKPVEIPESEYPGGSLTARDLGEVASVTITRRGQEPWTITRNADGEVHLEGDSEWTPNERITAIIQDAMANLVYADILSEDPEEYRDHLDEFGLDDPYIIAQAQFSDGQSVTVRLGDRMPTEDAWYYMTVDGDDRLYAVSPALADDLDYEKEMLHPVTQPEIYPVLLDRISVSGQDGKLRAEWQLQGKVTDQDASVSWMITAPFRYPADEEIIENLKASAGNLRMGIYLEDATEEHLAARGLDYPEYTLQLHMASGSTGTVSTIGVYDVVDREESTVTLFISRSANEMIDYVRFGDEVFSVSHFTLSAFLDTDAGGTEARYIAAIPLNSLESMTVEQDGKTTEYILERTGETDPETAEEKITCRRNGEEIAYDAFAAAYERLLTVNVSGKLPGGAEWKEAHTTYTFHTVSGGTHTVRFSDWDGMHDAVTLDGETRFYLIRGGAVFDIGSPEEPQ